MRLGSGALGLRGRIVGAVILTTVATLVVAAVALLGPLEQKLRAAEFKTFQGQVAASATKTFAQITNLQLVPDKLKPVPKPRGKLSREDAASYEVELQAHSNAEAAYDTLLDTSGAFLQQTIGASEVAIVREYQGQPWIVRVPASTELASSDSLGDALALLQSRARRLKPHYDKVSIGGTEYARAAVAFTTPSSTGVGTVRWVLAVRKPFAEVSGAVHVVRTAFLDAALAGLALTLVLAIPLAWRIVRRLRHLRQAALQLAETGPQAEFLVDRVRDEVGDLARAFAIMQTRLKQQEEARRAFVATASHELRTPLTSLEGMLELLEEDLASPRPDIEDARELIERARAQSHRLGRLAADLLDLSRIDAQVQLRSEPIELRELSRAVIAEFDLGTVARGIGAELHGDGEPVWALGDPGSVARILRILLDNAVRVSPPGSEIVVELHAGEQAGLTVGDEGPGVPAEERELIFQRFQRGRSTSGQAGFGLGLAIGRELAERMGGRLVLEDHSGPGARFTLHLPVATAPEHDTLVLI